LGTKTSCASPLLGAIYVSHLSSSLAAAGGAGTSGGAAASSMTPQLLRSLPEAAQELFRQAVTNGVTALFIWAAVVAAAGIVIALFIRQVPLRGGARPETKPDTKPDTAAIRDAEPVAVGS
jgi:hypothetical protein